jgi:hypothetical protein
MKTRFIITAMTILLLATPAVHAEVRHYQIGEGFSLIKVQDEAWEPGGFEKPLILRAPLVKQEPTIDGKADDQAWAQAQSLTVPLAYGPVKEATLKAVYTEKEIFLLVSWPDPTRDDQHHPWVWDDNAGRYVEGPQIEDSVLVSIEGGCNWSPSLLAGHVYDFDAWRWLAARTNPMGQAVDADGSVQNQWYPDAGFVKYASRNTKPFWNIKFNDRRPDILTKPWQELKRVYRLAPVDKDVYVRHPPDGSRPPAFVERLPAPKINPQGMQAASVPGPGPANAAAAPPRVVPQFQPVKLTGDAGEVAAKGHWADGRWTVEFRRVQVTRARTGSDSVFERTTQFSIHVFDHTERADEASESGRLYFQFEPAKPARSE